MNMFFNVIETKFIIILITWLLFNFAKGRGFMEKAVIANKQSYK